MARSKPVVFVVDDNDAFRNTLVLLFETLNIEVKAYASAKQFLDDYNPYQIGCLVLDIRMPEMSGLELQKKLREKQNLLPVIIITGHADVPMAIEAMKMGAFDFIEKPFRDQVLLDSVNRAIVTNTKTWQDMEKTADVRERMSSLTYRERQVLEGIVAGKTNKTIAKELGLSPKTTDFHRCNIMEKMGVNSAVQLTQMVLKAKLTDENK
jgi:two-component system, LuxR family, response regulator FixJ